jgi:alpha-1,2-mannosyltransferase
LAEGSFGVAEEGDMELRSEDSGSPTRMQSAWPPLQWGSRLMWFAIGVVSAGGVLILLLSMIVRQQLDFDVYRMGGAHVFASDLYGVRLGRTNLPFTYPPFAALLFWPVAHLPVRVGQIGWSVLNVGALVALVAVCIRALRPDVLMRRSLSLSFVLFVPVMLLRPDLDTLLIGQINVFIVLMVVTDLTCAIRVRSRTVPRGVLVGTAAAVKLTPLIFIPLLVLTRQFRAALTATATFVVCTLGTFVLAPHTSRHYLRTEIFDSGRSGNLLYVSDQNLRSALQRMIGTPAPRLLLDALTIMFAVAGLALAAWAYRTSSPMLGIVLCAAIGLIISPVSWSHHYVWIVPVLAWLVLGKDRPNGAWRWAIAAAVLFWAAPIWWVPDRESGYGGPLVLLAGNSFFLAAVGFLLLSSALLWTRGRARGGSGSQPGGRSGGGAAALGAGYPPAVRDRPVPSGAVQGPGHGPGRVRHAHAR